MKFSQWQKLWSRHAETPSFARVVAEAKRIAAEGARKGHFYASLSGGKDSCAMVGVMVEVGLGRFRCAHAASALSLPGGEEAALAVCEKYDLPLDVEEPEADAFGLLAALPLDQDAFEKRHMDALLRHVGSGNLMVNYAYRSHLNRAEFPLGGLTVAYVGLRADESRARALSLRTHGPIYQNKIDAMWRVCPLARWSVRDVWAFVTSREIPVHPYYARACDELGMDPEQLRTDLIVAPEGVGARGALQPIRRLYPDLWRRLCTSRPEAVRYG